MKTTSIRLSHLALYALTLHAAASLTGCAFDAESGGDDDASASEDVGSGNASELWGTDGSKWSPKSRLPDFSFAGYHSSKDPLPPCPSWRT